MKTQKASKKKSQFWKTLRYTKPHRKYLFGMFCTVLLSSAAVLILPILEAQELDAVINFDLKRILILGAIILVVYALAALFNSLFSDIATRFTTGISKDLRVSLSQNIMNLETQNFDKKSSGVLINTLTTDVYTIPETYRVFVARASQLIRGFISIIIVFFINVYIGLFFFGYVVIVYVYEQWRMFQYMKSMRIHRRQRDVEVSFQNEILRGIRDVKDLNIKDTVMNENKDLIQKTVDANILMNKQRNWQTFWGKVLKYFFDFSFFALCGLLIFLNNLTLPSFLIVFMYFKGVSNISAAIIEIVNDYGLGNFAAERIFNIIDSNDYPKEKWGNKTLSEPLQGNIEFHSVTFAYNDDKVLKNLNLKINGNTCTAIVGKSGIGKSTILSLINRSYELNNGEITLDGVNINELTEASLRKNICVVSQAPYIFNLTVAENLRLVKENATDEELIEVCKKAHIYEFINSLEQKFDTLLGENGVILSGGQKQRLAIARALLSDSQIILLDEATSALDNESQKRIKDIIRELSKDHTILIVAHRLSTVVDADKIIVLDKEGVVGEGKHNELLKNCTVYRNLYNKEN